MNNIYKIKYWPRFFAVIVLFNFTSLNHVTAQSKKHLINMVCLWLKIQKCCIGN